MANWLQRYVQVAQLAATWSKDRTTQVGAAIYNPRTRAILSLGYNGFPRGVDDTVESRHARPDKYLFTEHAERNAIFNAARHGVALDGMGIALGWFPCADCARAIVQSGITEMVATQPDLTPGGRWVEHHTAAREILREAGVVIIYLDPETGELLEAE